MPQQNFRTIIGCRNLVLTYAISAIHGRLLVNQFTWPTKMKSKWKSDGKREQKKIGSAKSMRIRSSSCDFRRQRIERKLLKQQSWSHFRYILHSRKKRNGMKHLTNGRWTLVKSLDDGGNESALKYNSLKKLIWYAWSMCTAKKPVRTNKRANLIFSIPYH